MNNNIQTLKAFKGNGVVDLGEQKAGSKVPFEFTYTGPEKIDSAKKTCGCTALQVSDKKVVGTIAIASTKGDVQKNIWVYIDDGEPLEIVDKDRNRIVNKKKKSASLTIKYTAV